MKTYTQNANPTQANAVSLLSSLPDFLCLSLGVSQDINQPMRDTRLIVYGNGSVSLYSGLNLWSLQPKERLIVRLSIMQSIRKLGFKVEEIGKSFAYINFKPLEA